MSKQKKVESYSLDQYDQEEIFGTITEMDVGTLREFIDEEYWDKFVNDKGETNLDVKVVHLEIRCGDDMISDNLTLPKLQGYEKSNLKKVRVKNPELPKDLKDWIGKQVRLVVKAKGQKTFLKLAM